VCVPTTPAQIFHLLRRQMLRSYRKPLVVMTPKSLLRHKEAVSTLDELANGRFETVIGDVRKPDAKRVRRAIVCSGKIYYELAAARRERKADDIAIVRLEQQYPFPHDDFKATLAQYPSLKEVVWCQEEPQNQGAWYRLRAYLRNDMPAQAILAYAGRKVSASPAVGYTTKHNEQQQALIDDAFADSISGGEMLIQR
jgi:2-oxoglutarate dehydrogenase E1 component